jgi:hypothetical protein
MRKIYLQSGRARSHLFAFRIKKNCSLRVWTAAACLFLSANNLHCAVRAAIAIAGHVFRPELFVICCSDARFTIYLRALNFSSREFAKVRCVRREKMRSLFP